MFIELVQALRCPRPHELSWLVAASSEMRDRDIVRGVLGCPVCHAEYPIDDGIVDFRDSAAAAPPRRSTRSGAALEEEPLRLAALLGLASPGGFVTLTGGWAVYANALGRLAERVHVLVMDPGEEVRSGGGISIAIAGGHLPLHPGAARGIALDESHVSPGLLAAAADALRAHGRLVAPATALVPVGMRELARDARHWVAEKEVAPGPLLSLSLGRAEA
ncbi:MAG TPA: hypothetical protein VJ803_09940 [Gemmatimonadaceae bacterium]|nr:hypothetical protein [Gemmatimonadaceae bacterium]